jgi:hypothetical protein
MIHLQTSAFHRLRFVNNERTKSRSSASTKECRSSMLMQVFAFASPDARNPMRIQISVDADD